MRKGRFLKCSQGGLSVIVRKLLRVVDRHLLLGLLTKVRRQFRFGSALSTGLGIFLIEIISWSKALSNQIGPLALRLSSGFGCERSEKWLAVFDVASSVDPELITEYRLQAFHRAWCIGDLNRGMAYQDRFAEEQARRRQRFAFLGDSIAVSKTVFTANHSTHAYLDVHLKAMGLGLSPPKKIIAAMDQNAIVRNPAMMKLWEKYVEVLVVSDDNPSWNLLDLYERDFTVSALINKRSVYIEYAKAIVQSEWEKRGLPPLLSLAESAKQRARLEMTKLGLGVDEPFVALHVRDNGSKLGSWQNSGSEDFRNADVVSYLDAVECLVREGLTVVRVGDPAMKPVPNLPGLIDYARSDVRSASLDLFLFSQCEFFVGMSSGPILVPVMFGTPTVGTNFVPFSARLQGGNSIFLPKRLLRSNGEYLSFENALKSSIAHDFSGAQMLDQNLQYEDNSPRELAEACLEMLGICRDEALYSTHDVELQKRANILYQAYSPYGSQGNLGIEFLRVSEKLGML